MSTKITDLRGSRVTPIHRGSVLEAGGKPSTWFPPEELVELTGRVRSMGMSPNEFLMENSKFSKISKMSYFSNFTGKLRLHLT